MSSLSSSTNNHQTPSTSTQPSALPLPQYSGLKTPSTSTSSSSSHQMALLNLNSINNNKSVLLVNVKELNLRVYNEIIVSWNILEATSMHDWIGLFKKTPIADDTSYLDIQRVNGAKIGHVSWSLGKLKSLQFGSALKPDDLVEFRYHTNVNLRPCGAVLACSIALPIRLQTTVADSAMMANSSLNQSSPFTTPSSNTSLNTSSSSSSLLNLNRFSSSLLVPPNNRDDEFITFRISDIKGAQLRKGVFFNPDPYVKISIVSSNGSSKAPNSNDTSNSVSFNNHSANINIGNSSSNPTRSSLIYGHSREFKTFAATNTCFPNWKNENFVLVARLNDLINLEVKDKFARTKPSINRFLGRVLVDVNQLVEKVKLNKGKYHFTFDLTKRTNSDTNITGSLSFTFSTFSATSNKFQSNSAPPLSNNNTNPSVSQPGKSSHHNHHNHHHHQSLTSSPSTPLISNNANNTIAAVNINNNNSLSSLKSNHSTQSSPPPVTSQKHEEASSSSQLSQCLFALEINSSENSLNNLPPPLEESQSPDQSSKKAVDQASGPTTAAVSSASSSSSSTAQDEPKKQQTYSSSSSSSSRSTSSDETAINEETQHLNHQNIQQEEEEENNDNDIDIEEEFSAPNDQQQQQQQSNPTIDNHHHQILPSSSSSSSSSSNSSANSSLSNSISNLVNSPAAATNQPAVSSTVVTTNDNRLSSLKKTVLRKKFNESRSKSLDQLKQSSSSARSKSLSNPNVNSQVSTPKIDTKSSLVTCQTTPIATATTKRANLYLKRNESADNKSSPVSLLTSNLSESNRITETIVVDEPPVSRESELEKAKRSINNAVRIGEKEECKKRRDEEEQDAECSSSRISATSSSSSNQATACRHNHHMIEEEQPKEQEETRSSEEAASSSSKMPCTTGGDPLVSVESPSTSSSSSSSPMEASTHLEPVTKLIETSENSAAAAVKPSEVKPSATSSSSRKSNKLVDQQHLTVIDSNVASELPPLWEARVDHLGRVFYIDHINRTTTWKKPRMATIHTSGAGTTSSASNGSTPRDQQQHHSYELEKQRLDKRYQSIRRTISNNHDAESVYSNKAKQVKTGSNPTTSVVSEGASSSSGVGASTNSSSSSSSLATVVAASSSSATGTSGAAAASIEPEESSTSSIAAGSTSVAPEAAVSSSSDPLLEQPGAQFILRADLLAVIRKNAEAKELVKSSSSLATILQRVRTNPSYYYKKYQHNKDLVRFLNLFAMRDEPMPAGWEIKCEFEKSDKVFFVDHNSRSTTFIDPRLPLPKPSNSNTHITTITTISPPSTLQRNATNSSTPTTTTPTSTEEVAETPMPTSSSQSQRPSDWASIKVPTTNTHHHHHNHQESATAPSGSSSSSSSSSKKTSSSALVTPGVLQPPAFPPPPPPALPPSLPPPPQQQQQSTITTATSSSSSSSTSSSYRASPHVATAVVAASAPPPPAPEPVHFSSHQQPSTATTTQSATGISNNSNISYADRVVAFVQQPNLFDVLKKNNIQLTSKQREKLNLVRQSGRSVYDRMSGDIDMASVVSQLEEMIMSFVVLGSSKSSPSSSSSSSTDTTATTPVATTATTEATSQATQPSTSLSSSSNQSSQLGSKNLSYKFPASSSSLNPTTSTSPSNAVNNNRRDYQRSFQTKLRNFYRKLESKGYGQGPQKSKIMVRRDKLLDDARVKVMQLSKHELRKNKLFICFQGEEGLDYGGPAREFFYLLSRELFNPYYGLFEYSASDMYTVQISSMSTYQDHVLEWFQFAGRVIGVALIHQYLLDAFFTRPFYKALLRDTNWTLSDLETLDPEFCQSLVYVKENDVTGLDFTFSVTENKCGKVIERDLKENGRNITVTEKNKMEYIQRMIKWRVERDVQKQTEALVRGFLDVVDPKHVQLFDARELELVLCGTVEIDVTDWKKHTDYRSGYHAQHPVIQWFWQAVDRFDNEQKLKLLQFVTGTSSIPHEGFAALRGSNGPRKFCIERWGTLDALPRAHTCFNRLDLPPYSSFDVLYEKLLLAIEETSGFCIQ